MMSSLPWWPLVQPLSANGQGVRPRACPTLPRNGHRSRLRSDVVALLHVPAADPFERRVVLSDHEQERLCALKRPFRAEDAAVHPVVRHTRARRLRRQYGDSASLKIEVVAAVLLGALLLHAGSPGGAPAFAAAVGLIWLVRRLPRSVSPLGVTVTNQPIADDSGRADPPSGSGQTDVDHETPKGKQ